MKHLFILCSLYLVTSLTAQIKITQIHLNSGSFMEMDRSNSPLSDFALLAPGSSILNQDFSAYENGMGFFGMGMTNSTMVQSIQLGLNFEKCPKGTLRIGLSNVSNNLLNTYGSYFESHVVDTFISTQSGNMFFVDSNIFRSYHGNYSNQQLRIDAAYIYEANAGKRWAFHAGVGASVGVSYKSTTTLMWQESINTEMDYDGDKGSSTIIWESYKNSMAWGVTAYAPLGIDFKLGKKRSFWMPFMIYSEVRPSISFNTIPNPNNKISVGLGSATGIRYNIGGK